MLIMLNYQTLTQLPRFVIKAKHINCVKNPDIKGGYYKFKK
jgi:hypothetical protein